MFPLLICFLILQMQPGISAHHSPPWQTRVLHQHNERSAGGPDWCFSFKEPQTDAAPHRVCCGKNADQLDVHLHVQLPQGEDIKEAQQSNKAGLITTALIFDFPALQHSSGNSGWAFLPAAVCNQAADQQGLHRRHHREGTLHSQWGVAAPGERWGQATGLTPHRIWFAFHTPSFVF